jgi:ATP-dependent DNA helicase RecQ
VQQVRAALDRPGLEISPRRQWPTGMDALGLDLRGKIPEGERAEPGRALARLDGLGWSAPLRELLEPAHGPRDDGEVGDAVAGGSAGVGQEAAHGHDGLLPTALRRPVQQVLEDWAGALRRGDGSAGVDGVVIVDSATRPELVRHLAKGVAHVLSAPLVGAVAPAPDRPAGRHDVNSAQRLAGIQRRLHLDLSDAARAGLTGRTVVLVDDFTDSGWTLAVAARLLRQAGAAAVHPFVLAQR